MQYLGDIYSSVLLKDVVSRNKIRDTALLGGECSIFDGQYRKHIFYKNHIGFLKKSGASFEHRYCIQLSESVRKCLFDTQSQKNITYQI